jgi:replicative superfamily II helicase
MNVIECGGGFHHGYMTFSPDKVIENVLRKRAISFVISTTRQQVSIIYSIH